MSCELTGDGTTLKVGISLISVVLTWVAKVLWDEYSHKRRWRRLSPLVVKQILNISSVGENCHEENIVRQAATRLINLEKTTLEIVAAGVKDRDWFTGLQLIIDCLEAAQSVQWAVAQDKANTLVNYRRCSKLLKDWAD